MAKISKSFKAKLHSYFIQKLGAFDYRHGWLKCTCPYCGKENKYGINLSFNRTNCFVCGEHPNPIQLVMDLEKLDTYQELLQFIEEKDFKYLGYKEEEIELRTQEDLIMPPGFNLIGSNLDTHIGKAALNYVLKRGFKLNHLRVAGWGYGDSGPLFGYLIIPFFEDGKLIYYNARRFMGSGPRYRNPDTEDSGIGKSFIIYNKEALYMFHKVYLCEGAINAATLGEKAISSGGKSVSRYQINTILKSPVEEVIIILDPDAKMKALDVAFQLVNEKRVKVVYLPETKDINDLGKSISMQYIRETPYHTYSDLLVLKQKLLNNEKSIITCN